MKTTLKLGLSAISLTSLLALAACGGGGDGGSGASGASVTPPSTPQQVNATDPYTGQPAGGTPTTQISGMVVSGPTIGATVTAYLLNPDGTNGATIGQAVTDAAGKYAMTLSQPPSGMIRLEAIGGTFVSEADSSAQKNVSLELVAPYVTTALSSFIITPVTHIASQRISYMAAKQGSTLANAYTTASSNALQIVTGNNVIASSNRSHGGIDYLSIIPGSAQDTLNTYADALIGIEYFGVKFDLPSHTAVRLLAQSSYSNSPSNTDSNGVILNVGKWIGSTFDESQPYTYAQMSSGVPNVDIASIVMSMNAASACANNDHAAYYARYPQPAGQITDYLDASACAVYTNNMAAIKAKTATNNRRKYVS
ncbi:hypothetical protein BJN34_36960 (plasmid) [Cupriavidus necator]|uniref:Carboxypeptidase regulatory-like domain-containing protein n=1 Tax=Cupriavidus necator TaxID=106590 RepID=A0A1U9V4C2_CUPNE|nr:hypothetical protein [Cupriavidus necator]AQV99467.1 hypothetical protein BJN34_36960 [Cupriavidus necator]